MNESKCDELIREIREAWRQAKAAIEDYVKAQEKKD